MSYRYIVFGGVKEVQGGGRKKLTSLYYEEILQQMQKQSILNEIVTSSGINGSL